MSGDRSVQIRSYRVCFNVERRIHKLDRWRVPLPYGVPVRGLVYFVGAVMAVLVLSQLPIFSALFGGMNAFTRFGVVPGGIAFGLYRLSLDGRPSHAVAMAWLRMQTEPGRMSAFRRLTAPEQVTLGSIVLAPDERGARLRPGVVDGPAELIIRYAADTDMRRNEVRLAQSGDKPLWRGKRIVVNDGQRVVIA